MSTRPKPRIPGVSIKNPPKSSGCIAAISEMISALDLVTDVSINEFENPDLKLTEAKDRFEANVNTRYYLMRVQYEIRRQVSLANAESGINDLLAELAITEKDIALYSKLSKLQPSLEIPVITGKLEKIKVRGEDQYYGREDNVKTSIFKENEIKDFKTRLASLKKGKVRLQDQLLERNIQKEIELSKGSVDLLAQSGII